MADLTKLTDEEFEKLQRIASFFHGTGAAVGVALEEGRTINLHTLRSQLRSLNKLITRLLEPHGGWRRHRATQDRLLGPLGAQQKSVCCNEDLFLSTHGLFVIAKCFQCNHIDRVFVGDNLDETLDPATLEPED